MMLAKNALNSQLLSFRAEVRNPVFQLTGN